MIEKIKQIQNGIISIYTNKYDLNVFYAGKYIDNDKKYLMIQSVNPNGEEDGLMCIKITDIYNKKSTLYVPFMIKLLVLHVLILICLLV